MVGTNPMEKSGENESILWCNKNRKSMAVHQRHCDIADIADITTLRDNFSATLQFSIIFL